MKNNHHVIKTFKDYENKILDLKKENEDLIIRVNQV